MKEKYHDEVSHRWVEGFWRRYRISLRRKTQASAQKSPANLHTAIEKFHAKSFRKRKKVTFTVKDLGNMDPNAISFCHG